jgi:hypothetical protein
MNELQFLKPGCSRRVFLQDSIRLSAALPFLHFAGTEILHSKKPQMLTSITVNDVIEEFLKEIPGLPFTNTVDTIKSGDPATIVKGIVTTMFATHEVILKSIKAGANFIILIRA